MFIKFIHDHLQGESVQTIIIDGAGIGDREKSTLNWMRRAQVRKVKDHIRCEVVLIQYVGVGKRYSSDIKLLREILKGVNLRRGEVFSRQII